MTAPGGSRRVLLAVDHRRNGQILEQWLVGEHGFTATRDLEEDPFDLVVVDATAFARLRDELAAMRERERPGWLPVLLIVGQRHAARLGDDVWRVADEVLASPVRRTDLWLRIQRLLALRERSVATARRIAELGRSNVDLEQFAYVAAHELATPLAVVTGAITTIATHEREKLDPRVQPLLDAAEDQGERLQTLIQDLLSFSQAERVRFRPVALGDVLADALATLQPQIAAAEARVDAAALPVVRGDARQLRIVLTNLVGNAVKYRAAGRKPEIEITSEERGGEVVTAVRDNGRGVAPDRAEAIFEMFERNDRGAGGHGIGLALCRRIVERHGGRIWLEPAPGGGSIFRFGLPAAGGADESSG